MDRLAGADDRGSGDPEQQYHVPMSSTGPALLEHASRPPDGCGNFVGTAANAPSVTKRFDDDESDAIGVNSERDCTGE